MDLFGPSLLLSWVTILAFCSSDIHANTFSDFIRKAQCQARCNRKYGVQPRPDASVFFDVYPPYICKETSFKCTQCSLACSSLHHDEQSCVNHCVSDICSDSCMRYYGVERYNAPPMHGERLQLSEPVVTCRYSATNANESRGVHISYLRWNVRDTTNNESTSAPLCFVVALQVKDSLGNISLWRLLGKTNFSFIPTNNMTADSQFRFNVTAVGEFGTVDKTKVTEWAQMPEASPVPEEPREVTIVKQQVKYGKVSVLVKWKAADSGGCFFKLYCMGDGGIEDELQAKEVSEWPQFKYEFTNLMFDRKYTVQVHTFDKEYKVNSKPATTRFQTLSCLEHTNYSYVICEPDPPSNLSTTISGRRIDKNGRLVVNVTLSWLQPLHESSNNRINRFLITWHKHPPFPYSQQIEAHHGETSVPGWITSLVLPWLHMDSKYEIVVEAMSGGGSTPSTLFLELGIPYKDFMNRNGTESASTNTRYMKSTDKYVYILALLPACLASIASIVYFTYRKVVQDNGTRKGAVVAAKQEMNPLYGFVDNTDNCQEENDGLPVIDDFEIDPERLCFVENLGEGAFGKVLKADLGRPSSKEEPPTRTVAVKVLKDHASADERRSLLLEMEVMKQFGRHQNVVNMIGCCTKSSRICLIIEYCPFGDLRNYLRKYREKHLSNQLLLHHLLGGYCKEKTPINSDSGISQHSNQDYAGDGSRESRSTFAYSVPSSDNIADGEVFVEENVIDQTTLLSYARQIALGMEFLSLKKFVHRDLAARNILVHNHRLLKISDFGLCRDVYETNIYQPTSGQRLPYKWMALESIFDHLFTTKSDIWSYGIVLWEIVTLGGCPYPGIPNKDLFRLLKDGYRMERPENCSNEIYEIMLSCWKLAPEDRPCFTELRYKFESLLEATRSYIDLTVSVNSDYYEQEASTDRQLSTILSDGVKGEVDRRQCHRNILCAEETMTSSESESGTECSFASHDDCACFWDQDVVSEYDLDIDSESSSASLQRPYRVAVLRAPSLRNGMMTLLGKVARRGQHARLRENKHSLSLSEVYNISTDDNLDAIRASPSGYIAM